MHADVAHTCVHVSICVGGPESHHPTPVLHFVLLLSGCSSVVVAVVCSLQCGAATAVWQRSGTSSQADTSFEQPRKLTVLSFF